MIAKNKYIGIILSLAPIILGIWIYVSPYTNFAIIRNYGPDFLWSFSLLFTQFTFNSFNGSISSITLSSILVSLIYEFGQKINWLDGTFDLYDLVAYFSGFIVALLTIRFLKKRG
jgi:hypothetical protein